MESLKHRAYERHEGPFTLLFRFFHLFGELFEERSDKTRVTGPVRTQLEIRRSLTILNLLVRHLDFVRVLAVDILYVPVPREAKHASYLG